MKLRSSLLLIGLLSLLPLLSGCIERKMTIKSKPDDALLYLNGEQQGRTPQTIKFHYYGSWKVRLEKEGHQIHQDTIEVSRPAYEYFPLNIFTELLIPHTFKVHKEFSFELTPTEEVSREEVMKRARKLQSRTRKENNKDKNKEAKSGDSGKEE